MHAYANSNSGFPSDTNLLVDACIQRVRETARLDDDAVLPPFPAVAPRRDVIILTKSDTAGSAAGSAYARSTPCSPSAGDALGAKSIELDATQSVSRRSAGAGSSRWAVVLCALVAGSFGTASFLASPLGQKPSVVRVRDAARSHASHAMTAATSAIHGIAR